MRHAASPRAARSGTGALVIEKVGRACRNGHARTATCEWVILSDYAIEANDNKLVDPNEKAALAVAIGSTGSAKVLETQSRSQSTACTPSKSS